MKIVVSTSTLNNEVTNQNNNIELYYAFVNALEICVEEIGNIWQGTDYDQFASKMTNFNQELKRFGESLESYSNFLNNYSKAVTDVDENYGEKIINLE